MLRRGGKRIRMDDPPEDYEPPFTPYSVQPQTPADQQRLKCCFHKMLCTYIVALLYFCISYK